MMNDGMFEMNYFDGLVGLGGALKLFDKAESGGLHVYENNGKLIRI